MNKYCWEYMEKNSMNLLISYLDLGRRNRLRECINDIRKLGVIELPFDINWFHSFLFSMIVNFNSRCLALISFHEEDISAPSKHS